MGKTYFFNEFEIAKSKEKYFGWDEPSKIDFQTL